MIVCYTVLITYGTTPGAGACHNTVEALRYNTEGRGFNSQWCHWNFSLT